MNPKNIERINELARISKQRELTREEEAERARLRAEYLESFRAGFRQQLENTAVEYPGGEKKTLKQHFCKPD